MMKNQERIETLLRDFVYDNKQPIYKSSYIWDNKTDGKRAKKSTVKFGSSWTKIDKKFFEEEAKRGNKYSKEEQERWIREYQEREKSEFVNIGPFTLEEARRPRKFMPQDAVEFSLIPEKFYNKKVVIGDYELHFQHDYRNAESVDERVKFDQEVADSSSAILRCYARFYEQWNITLKYHGLHLNLGQVFISDSIQFDYAKNEKGFKNWFHIKLNAKKNCVLEEEVRESSYDSFHEKLEELVPLLAQEDLKIEDSDLPFIFKYDFILDPEDRKKQEKLKDQNAGIDFEWFVKDQTKDGVYAPTRSIIDKIYTFPRYNFKISEYANHSMDILKRLNIHTVQMKDSVHFPVDLWYDMKGVSVKAPKKVIERYGYEKLCDNKETVKKIAEERKEEKRKADLAKYNNTFSLIFHGKTILKDKQAEEIIAYLENKESRDMEQNMIDSVKPIFEKFPEIAKLEICTFGTHYMYELAGESHFNTELDNKHIDRETWEQITQLYEDCFYYPDEDVLENKYGWPERGALLLGVKRTDKGLKVYTEKHDLRL